jgi:hypothetical protein
MKTDKYTLSRLLLTNQKNDLLLKSYIMELPYRNNEVGISCIKTGIYQVFSHNSPKFGKCFKIQNVEKRDEILIHKGNYPTDTRGCLLIGSGYRIGDNYINSSLYQSKEAFDRLLGLNIISFELLITELC